MTGRHCDRTPWWARRSVIQRAQLGATAFLLVAIVFYLVTLLSFNDAVNDRQRVADGDVLSVAQECQQALGYPARTAEDIDWLTKCEHALRTPAPEPSEPTPGPSPSSTPTGTPTASPSASPTPDSTPTATPAPSPTSPTQSPTPTPSPTPPAWPGPDNTGVPLGTALTTYTGSCTITTPNTVIDAKLVNCSLAIRTTGVRITRSRVVGSVDNGTRTGTGFYVGDSEIIAAPNTTSVGEVNYTVERSELSGGNRGGHCYSTCIIRDSWVHGQRITGSTHASGLRAGMNTNFIHNTIGCDVPDTSQQGGCSASLTMYPDFSPVSNVLIQDNLIKATPGYFCSYGGNTRSKPYSSDPANATLIRFIGNVYERGPSGHCGGPRDGGPITDWRRHSSNVWSGNRYDNGTVIAQP